MTDHIPTQADPLPPVRASGFAFEARALTQLPVSADGGPVARIQQVAGVPGTDVLAALDTRGLVWAVGADGAVAMEPMIDLRGANGFTEPGPESGLRSIAFHPDFATLGAAGYGKVYLAYSADAGSAPAGTQLFEAPGQVRFHDVVAEYEADPDTLVIDPGSARELFRTEQVFTNHNFGQMAFDPDAAPGSDGYGLLHMGLGDGGGANDPLDAGGDLATVLGKILRIDPLAAEGDAYTVPSGNPFADGDGALPEIYAYGFRNPQQLSFDEGRLFAADIGQALIEEVNLVRMGADHGWNAREGTFVNDAAGRTGFLPEDDAGFGYQYPVLQYDHEEIGGSAAVGGGYVAGDAAGAADGAYVFTDFPSGRVFALPGALLDGFGADDAVTSDMAHLPGEVLIVDADGMPTSFAEIAGNASGRVDLRLGLLPDGGLVAYSKQDGTIYRLIPADGARLSGTDGDDEIIGTFGSDTITGGAGDDVLYGDGPPAGTFDDGF